MGSRKISIAVTPNGSVLLSRLNKSKLHRCSRLADAVTRGSDNKLYFAEPYVEQMTMADFLSKLTSGTVQPLVLHLFHLMFPAIDKSRFNMLGYILSTVSEWKSLLQFLLRRGWSGFAFGV
jgi:hypothetical protein